MFRLTLACFVLMVTMSIWHFPVDGGGPEPANDNFQGDRLFDDVCANCIVSNGMGFAVDENTCNCYYTCVLVTSNKLAIYASQWVSTRRCCPCGMSWSMKLLTCIDFKDKRSDCFKTGDGAPANPCAGKADGDLIPRSSVYEVDGPDMCAGFIRCVSIPTQNENVLVPDTDCCPDDECFDESIQNCSTNACYYRKECYGPLGEPVQDCPKGTTAPPSECQYTSVASEVTKFMGKENMITFTCAPGTCWDEDLCACVATNNTAYNDCDRPFLEMDFSNDQLNVEDGSGNTIWAEASEKLEISGEEAEFDSDYINIGGVANTFLSNVFVLRIELTLTEDDTSSYATDQCVMGNCFVADMAPSPLDTISVTVEREDYDPELDPDGPTPGDAVAEEFHIDLTYQNKAFMIGSGDGMTNVELEIEGTFDVDAEYELWVIYCGEEEYVLAGVLDSSEELTGYAYDIVPDSKQLIMGQSGFVFGRCPSGDDFEGDISKVEFWRECKPWGVTEFVTAFDKIYYYYYYYYYYY